MVRPLHIALLNPVHSLSAGVEVKLRGLWMSCSDIPVLPLQNLTSEVDEITLPRTSLRASVLHGRSSYHPDLQ
jgi:hypothetical protein